MGGLNHRSFQPLPLAGAFLLATAPAEDAQPGGRPPHGPACHRVRQAIGAASHALRWQPAGGRSHHPPGLGLGWTSSLSPKAAVASTLLESLKLASGPQPLPAGLGPDASPCLRSSRCTGRSLAIPRPQRVQAQNPVAPVVWPLHRPAACFHVPLPPLPVARAQPEAADNTVPSP